MLDALIEAATGRRAILAAGGLLIFGTVLFQLGPYATVKGMTDAPTLPEEGLTTSADLGRFLTGLGEAGRAAYVRFQLWDLLNLVLFGAAGVLVIGWLISTTGLAGTGWRRLMLLPLLLVAADLSENALLGWAVARHPDPAASSAALRWITGTKFAAAILMLVAIAALLIVAGVRRLMARSG